MMRKFLKLLILCGITTVALSCISLVIWFIWNKYREPVFTNDDYLILIPISVIFLCIPSIWFHIITIASPGSNSYDNIIEATVLEEINNPAQKIKISIFLWLPNFILAIVLLVLILIVMSFMGNIMELPYSIQFTLAAVVMLSLAILIDLFYVDKEIERHNK